MGYTSCKADFESDTRAKFAIARSPIGLTRSFAANFDLCFIHRSQQSLFATICTESFLFLKNDKSLLNVTRKKIIC